MEELSDKWHKALKQEYWPDIAKRQELTDFATRLTNHKKGNGYYNTAPALSPKGDMIAYISNRNDFFDVFIANAKNGKIIKDLISGNQTADFEELHLLTPGLCWSPDERKIAIAVKSGNEDAIYIVDVESEDMEEIPVHFNGIFSVQWNPFNNSLVFVGDNSQQSDIYVYHINEKKLEQITNDVFSDMDPTWSRDGEKIYFTSDRGDNTELDSIPTDFDMAYYKPKKRLYVYDMNTRKLSKFGGEHNESESHVVFSKDGKKSLYISDKSGVSNIYLRDMETGEEKPITNSIDPITLLTITDDGKKLAFTALNDGAYDIFYINNPFDIDLKIDEVPKTVFVAQKEIRSKLDKSIDLKNLVNKIEGKDTSSYDSTSSQQVGREEKRYYLNLR